MGETQTTGQCRSNQKEGLSQDTDLLVGFETCSLAPLQRGDEADFIVKVNFEATYKENDEVIIGKQRAPAEPLLRRTTHLSLGRLSHAHHLALKDIP